MDQLFLTKFGVKDLDFSVTLLKVYFRYVLFLSMQL